MRRRGALVWIAVVCAIALSFPLLRELLGGHGANAVATVGSRGAPGPEPRGAPSAPARPLADLARPPAVPDRLTAAPQTESKTSPAGAGPAAPELERAVSFLKTLLPGRYGDLTAAEAATLTTVDLRGAKLHDEDLELLLALPQLQSLSLHETGITDAALATIAAMPNLTSLDLRGTLVTGAGLPMLPAARLEALHLTDTKVAPEDIWNLPSMPSLRVLKLNGIQVTDASLQHLPVLPSLQHLELDRTAITSDGVRRLLASYPGLRRIELRFTTVTEEDSTKLDEEFPGVEFVVETAAPGIPLGR